MDGRELIIRADASALTGFGHFVRCCAMAAYMRGLFRCHIYSWDSTGRAPGAWVTSQAADAGAVLHVIQAPDLDSANNLFLQALAAYDRPLTVLDNYYYQADYQRRVRSLSRALICLDDMHDHHFVADLLISFVPLDAACFSMERHTRFLSGFRWSFLREPFLRPLPAPSRPRRSVMVAMGGADPLGLTSRLLPRIRQALPDNVLEVVAGASVHLDSAVDALPRTVIHRTLDAAQMADLFDRSCLGIFPASTICVEAFARRVPVAAGFFTDNQHDFYRHGVGQGLFLPLGDLRDPQLDALAEAVAGSSCSVQTCDIDFNDSRRQLREIFLEYYNEVVSTNLRNLKVV